MQNGRMAADMVEQKRKQSKEANYEKSNSILSDVLDAWDRRTGGGRSKDIDYVHLIV
jgi:hypothetical protein